MSQHVMYCVHLKVFVFRFLDGAETAFHISDARKSLTVE